MLFSYPTSYCVGSTTITGCTAVSTSRSSTGSVFPSRPRASIQRRHIKPTASPTKKAPATRRSLLSACDIANAKPNASGPPYKVNALFVNVDPRIEISTLSSIEHRSACSRSEFLALTRPLSPVSIPASVLCPHPDLAAQRADRNPLHRRPRGVGLADIVSEAVVLAIVGHRVGDGFLGRGGDELGGHGLSVSRHPGGSVPR